MARNKLIAKYATLNTEDLPERIYNKIQSFIESEGIEDLPYLELSGRWTGKLSISNGGWRNDFDLLCPVLAMCRVDRHGVVHPDLNKIHSVVSDWVNYLTTPKDGDEYIGTDDESFSDDYYVSDDVNDFHSAAYAAEMKSFMHSDHPDMLEHDQALTEIDTICRGERDERPEQAGDRLFEEGFQVTKITNADDFRKMMEAMESDAAAGGETWVSPDFDMEEIEKMFERTEEQGPSWMEFIDDLRNGRYGELPEDYDGLARPEGAE